MPGMGASTSWVTRSARTASGRMATGTLGRARLRRASSGSRGRLVRSLVPGNQAPWPLVRAQLNGLLRGWSAYFGYGTRLLAYRAVDNHVKERVRNFLRHRHKGHSGGSSGFSDAVVFGKLGVLRLRDVHLGPLP